MPDSPSYPGVYIDEIPSGARDITGVATSITAFLGRALRGPVNEPTRIRSFAEFERLFGGLWQSSTMSYAVQQYFLNGGTDALIVRFVNGTESAAFVLPPGKGANDLRLEASSEGSWGDNLRVSVDYDTFTPAEADRTFNLLVTEVDPSTNEPRVSEAFRDLSIDAEAARYVGKVLREESALLRMPDPHPAPVPTIRPARIDARTPASPSAKGNDGLDLTFAEYEGVPISRSGIYALDNADLFNLLCIPPFTRETDVASTTWGVALEYCRNRRAMLIVDPQSGWRQPSQVTSAAAGVDSLNLRNGNAAIYFPRVRMIDPLQGNRLEEFVPCGVVAGIFARIDARRGVWKAPAGTEATLTGVRELVCKLNDGESGTLNALGVNCLRTLPAIGNVLWGARTLEGADRLASQWKYVCVRRLALFVEESLYRGTKWAVFEPNDEPTWARIRLGAEAFMHRLFRQGAFQGTTPREAYFVRCDGETTTQSDRDRGIMNVVVGFAPLKPAEFVLIKIQQIAGQFAA